jgi:hypothetical protein
MTNFSIELSADRIVDARTRNYFAEVLTSYNNGCYRSAVVTLWSVVVCDLFFKLSELSSHYGDETAKSLLKDIEKLRGKNPNSPDWEWHLVEQTYERTQLLEAGDYANLEALLKHRHLSAHPVLNATEVLFEPSKDSARAHIRNALEGVLTKPPIMTKKIFDALVEDLEANAAVLPDKQALSRYLHAKYFPYLVPYVERSLFRSLWRLVFRSKDERCEKNREINLRALSILYERDKAACRAAIEAERPYFSDVGTDGSRFDSIVRFIGRYPELFGSLTDAAKTPLENAGKADLDTFARAWFLSESPAQHLDAVEKRISATSGSREFLSGEAFDELLAMARDVGLEERALDIAIAQFGWSHSFDMADGYFVSLIKPNLRVFNKTQLGKLIKEVESNNQIYGRGRAASQHRLIKQVVDTAFKGDFDYTAYPNFAESVGIDLKKLPLDEDEIPF